MAGGFVGPARACYARTAVEQRGHQKKRNPSDTRRSKVALEARLLPRHRSLEPWTTATAYSRSEIDSRRVDFIGSQF
jgi:hypothetical protein